MNLKFKFSLRWTIFAIILGLILDAGIIWLITHGYFHGHYIPIYIGLLILCSLFIVMPFMTVYGLRDNYVINYIFGFDTGVKHLYKNITYIQWVFPATIIIYKYNLPVGTYTPLLKNQELMIKIILEKNPNCKISKSVARKLKKKFGESYDQYVEE